MRKSIFNSILVTLATSYACQAQTSTKTEVLSETGKSVETTLVKTEVGKSEPKLSIHGKTKEAKSVNSKAARKPQLGTSEAIIKEDN